MDDGSNANVNATHKGYPKGSTPPGVGLGTDQQVSMEMLGQAMAEMEAKIAQQAGLIAYWVLVSKTLLARLFALSDETRVELTTQDLKDAGPWQLMVGDPQGEDEKLKGQVVGMFVVAPDVDAIIQKGGGWGKDGVRTPKHGYGSEKPLIVGLDGRPLG